MLMLFEIDGFRPLCVQHRHHMLFKQADPTQFTALLKPFSVLLLPQHPFVKGFENLVSKVYVVQILLIHKEWSAAKAYRIHGILHRPAAQRAKRHQTDWQNPRTRNAKNPRGFSGV